MSMRSYIPRSFFVCTRCQQKRKNFRLENETIAYTMAIASTYAGLSYTHACSPLSLPAYFALRARSDVNSVAICNVRSYAHVRTVAIYSYSQV